MVGAGGAGGGVGAGVPVGGPGDVPGAGGGDGVVAGLVPGVSAVGGGFVDSDRVLVGHGVAAGLVLPVAGVDVEGAGVCGDVDGDAVVGDAGVAGVGFGGVEPGVEADCRGGPFVGGGVGVEEEAWFVQGQGGDGAAGDGGRVCSRGRCARLAGVGRGGRVEGDVAAVGPRAGVGAGLWLGVLWLGRAHRRLAGCAGHRPVVAGAVCPGGLV
ncbi:hypothetical protein D7U36_11585 [Propionibacterium australiense]|uniref:Uncharacterized protein n=1 Tax=Propionibacterium australiense TaxID=119981 RepID=A0A8B3FMN0_9ACTN|nr:hypothetical protein D7U36_11585 [Propionibacterium australiense]